MVQQASQGALDSVVPPTAAVEAAAANDSSLASAAIAAGSSLAPSTPRRPLRVADARQQQQQVELAQLGATSPVPPGGMLSPVNLSVPGLPLPAGQVGTRLAVAACFTCFLLLKTCCFSGLDAGFCCRGSRHSWAANASSQRRTGFKTVV